MTFLEKYRQFRKWFGVTILEFGKGKLTLARCDYDGGGQVSLAVITAPPEKVIAKRDMVPGDKYKPGIGDTMLHFDNLHGLDNLIDTLQDLRSAFQHLPAPPHDQPPEGRA